MKKLLTLFALASLVLTACDKEEQWTQVVLNDDELTSATISPSGDPKSIRISGGSGDYSVVIDEPSVADVSIEPSYGAGILLVIEPKAEGEAVVTVTDTKSGLFARCQLKVALFTDSFTIKSILTDIDADSPEAIAAIEADLAADASIPPVGGAILMGFWSEQGDYAFVDAEGEEISRGTFVEERDITWNSVFNDLRPIRVQRLSGRSRGWTFSCNDGSERKYDVHFYDGMGESTRMNMQIFHIRLYEDLTNEYQEKYPDAGVKNVVRALVSKDF